MRKLVIDLINLLNPELLGQKDEHSKKVTYSQDIRDYYEAEIENILSMEEIEGK